MQHQAGSDHVEGGVREREATGVAVQQDHTISDPFPSGILHQRPGPVTAEVETPDIDADRLAGGQESGGPVEPEATPAADVQDALIASPGDQVAEPIPQADLGESAIPEQAPRDPEQVGPDQGEDRDGVDLEGMGGPR